MKDLTATVAVIAVIGVVGYLIVKNVGTQGQPFQPTRDDSRDTSLDGIRNIGATVKGWIMGPDKRDDGSLDIKGVRITDPNYAADQPSGLQLSLGRFEA